MDRNIEINVANAYKLYKQKKFEDSLRCYLNIAMNNSFISPYIRLNINKCYNKIIENKKSTPLVKHPLFFKMGTGYALNGGAIIFNQCNTNNIYMAEEQKLFKKENMKYKIVFISDSNPSMRPERKVWGAETSAGFVVTFGRQLGYDVIEVDPMQWDESAISSAQLLVLRSIDRLSREQFHFLQKILFEKLKPYVTYQHDYSFCVYRNSIKCNGSVKNNYCQDCVQEGKYFNGQLNFYTYLLQRSRLNIFISHPQRHIFGEALGAAIDPSIVILPPVDPKIFKPIDVKRNKNLIINTSGKLNSPNKGFDNIAEYIKNNPQFEYHLYTEKNKYLMEYVKTRKNIKVMNPINNFDLPLIYSQADSLVVMPSVMEPAGRTPVEAALCGCKVIANNKLGCMYFNLPLCDRDKLAKLIYMSMHTLWNNLYAVMARGEIE